MSKIIGSVVVVAVLLISALVVPMALGDEQGVSVEGYVCESSVGCAIDAPGSIDFGKLVAGTCCLAPAGSDITISNTSKWEPEGEDCGPLPTVTVSFLVTDSAPAEDSTLFHDHLSYACSNDCAAANLFSDDDPLDICMNYQETGPGSVKYKDIGMNLKGVSPTAGVVYSGTLTITCVPKA